MEEHWFHCKTEENDNACEKHANEYRHIVRNVLENNSQSETLENTYLCVELESLFLLMLFKITSEEFQRRKAQLVYKHNKVYQEKYYKRNNCCLYKCLCIPKGHICRQAVTSVVCTYGKILKAGIAKDITDHRSHQHYKHRRCKIMSYKLCLCVA